MNQLLKSRSRFCLPILFVFCSVFGTHAQIITHASLGSIFVNGDVDHVFDPLNSFHFGLSRPINHNFNAELKLGFGRALGLSGTFMESEENGGGLVEDAYEGMGENVWYPNYLSNYVYADLGVNYILNTGIERLRFIGGAGLGISNSSTRVNLFNNIGDVELRYTLRLPVETNLDDAKDAINRNYDSTYETNFQEGGLVPHLSLQFGIQFKITRGIYFSVDARHHISTSDYLDSIRYISATEDSGNNDSVSMITIGFMGYLLADEKEDIRPVK